MYAVRSREQRAIKSCGAGTKSCGVRTSVNKEYCKSRAACNFSCIFLERDPCLRRATNCCNWSRSSQTDGYIVFPAVIISANSPVSSRVSSSFYPSCFSIYVFSSCQQFLQLHLLQFWHRFANRIQDSIKTHAYSHLHARKLAPLPWMPHS